MDFVYTMSEDSNVLSHHGIEGQKWGRRRFQNEDGTLTEEGRKRYLNADGSLTKEGLKRQAEMEQEDQKWARKNAGKIIDTTKKQVTAKVDARIEKELSSVPRKNRDGSWNRYYLSKVSQILADEMSKQSVSVGNKTPNGSIIRFVAERGGYGVHIALGGEGDDLSFYKNGVSSSGKVAYRNKTIDMNTGR